MHCIGTRKLSHLISLNSLSSLLYFPDCWHCLANAAVGQACPLCLRKSVFTHRWTSYENHSSAPLLPFRSSGGGGTVLSVATGETISRGGKPVFSVATWETIPKYPEVTFRVLPGQKMLQQPRISNENIQDVCRVCVRLRMCECACVRAHVCVCECMRACMRAHVCVWVCMNACVRACVRTCVCECEYAHVACSLLDELEDCTGVLRRCLCVYL